MDQIQAAVASSEGTELTGRSRAGGSKASEGHGITMCLLTELMCWMCSPGQGPCSALLRNTLGWAG